MSHGLTTRKNGFVEMAYVGPAPWHQLGQNVAEEDAKNIPTLIEKSGLGWKVEQKDMFSHDGRNLGDWQKEVRRLDTNETIGTVGPNTEILQNHEAFEWFQPTVDSGEVRLETAGSLQGGAKVWVMGRLNSVTEIVKGDEILHYVLLSNSHDGTQSVRVGFTPIRVVCQNTLAIAKSSKDSKLIKVRHSKDVVKNINALRDVMNFAKASFEATEEQFKFLANKSINAKNLRDYIKIILKVDEVDGKIATRTENKIQEIMEIHEKKTGMFALAKLQQIATENILENFEAGRGTDNAPSRGTWWTAYNAYTEYLSHAAGRSPQTRYDSLWFGTNFKANADALSLAVKMAEES